MSGRPDDRPRHRSAGSRAVGSVGTSVVLVLLAAAAVTLTRPGDQRPSPLGTAGSGTFVTRTELGCPGSATGPRDGAGVDTTLPVGLAPLPGLSAAGEVQARGPAPDDGTRVDLARGRLADVRTVRDPMILASGGAAAGLFAFDVDRAGRSADRRLAVTACLAPRARWWFTGAGAGLDHYSTLTLADLDPGPAVVDLRVLGPDGEVATVATRGILVAPGSRRRLPLADLAPATDDLALEVHAQRGRVVASVADAVRRRASASPARDSVPGSEQPSRTVWLVGLPASGAGGGRPPAAGSGRTSGRPVGRTLLVANPGDLEAVVSVAVSGRNGSYVPTGVGEATVLPGAVTAVDLRRAVPVDEPVAVEVMSTEPVLASVRSSIDGDVAYAGAADALTGPAVAPLVRDTRASVQVTAGTVAARVRVAAYDGQGHRLGGRTLSVAPTATVAWSPAPTSGYVLVTPLDPGTGAVRGAVSYAGDGLASVPLVALPVREVRPHVEPWTG